MQRHNRMMKALAFLFPVALFATSYTVNQNGNWHTAATFTPNGTPGFGDTINNSQYVLTCETGQTCDIGTVNSTALTISDGTHAASLIVNGTLDLRGQGMMNGVAYDCSHGSTVGLGTGALIQLDENGGAVPSGFTSGMSACTIFNLGTPGDQCTWGTSTPPCPTNVTSINNGSANGILLQDGGNGNGSSVMNFNGVSITDCGSNSTTVGCSNGEFDNTFGGSSWYWHQVYLGGDGFFATNAAYGMASSVPIDINGAISQGRLGNTDVFFDTTCGSGAYSGSYPNITLVSPACNVTRSITNSLLRDIQPDGVHADIGTMGMTITNTFWDGLGNTDLSLASANIAGAAWSYVVAVTDRATCSEDSATYLNILAPTADHIYSLCPSVSSTDNPIMLTIPANSGWGKDIKLSYVIFDNPTTNAGNQGHGLNYTADYTNTFPVNLDHLVVLQNSLGTGGVGLTAWSSGCPKAPYLSITHSTDIAGATEGTIYFGEGGATVCTAPALDNFQGNIFVGAGTLNPIAFGGGTTPTNQPANMALSATTDYNVNYGFLPFVITGFTTACASGCTNSGSPYAVPMTGSTPGVHDMNVNPMLSNPAINAYTWAATQGQASSAAGFRNAFIVGGPSSIHTSIQNLFNYICSGYIPTNGSITHMEPDGSTPGMCQAPTGSSLSSNVSISMKVSIQ